MLDGQLSTRQLDELHDMLRGLIVERKSIEEGMMFCLDHSEAADEIVDALVESLTLTAAESPVEKKIARLYLVSDILHNASAAYPKTARFRTNLEKRLPTVMASCREAILTLGRISAESMKQRVTSVLDVWDSWSLYAPHSLLACRTAFSGKGAS